MKCTLKVECDHGYLPFPKDLLCSKCLYTYSSLHGWDMPLCSEFNTKTALFYQHFSALSMYIDLHVPEHSYQRGYVPSSMHVQLSVLSTFSLPTPSLTIKYSIMWKWCRSWAGRLKLLNVWLHFWCVPSLFLRHLFIRPGYYARFFHFFRHC